MNKSLVLLPLSIAIISITTSAFAAESSLPAGIPQEMLKDISKESPSKVKSIGIEKETVKKGDSPESKTPASESKVDPIRERIRSYLNKEIGEVKSDLRSKVDLVSSSPKAPVAESTNSVVKKTKVVEGAAISTGYQIPKGAVEVKASEDGYIHVNGDDGRAKVVAISRGLSNKIITPFANPKINSASKLTVKIEGNTIFIGSSSSKVSGVWIYDSGRPDVSVPIILMPKAVPPVSIRIHMPREKLFGDEFIPAPKIERVKAVDIPSASKAESSAPFEQGIVDMLDLLVDKRQYPDGYGVINYNDATAGNVCGHKEIQGKLKHRLEGDMFDIEIVSIKNFSQYPATVSASNCYQEGVVAITVNPPNYLAPKEVGELISVRLSKKYRAKKEDIKNKLRPVSNSEDW